MGRPAHGYSTQDGRAVPGVTTIIGELAKPALVGWAGKTVGLAAVDHGAACYAAGKEGTRAPAFPRWGEILYGKRDKAAADGTAAHNLFERHLNGEEVERSPHDSDGAWQAFENAKLWLSTTGIDFKVWSHERPMVHPSECFAGTPDAIARQDGKTWLADWKTGGLYPEHCIQMAAYRELLRECEGIEVEGCHLVRFHRDHGDFAHHFMAADALDQGWEIFHNLMDMRPHLLELRKRFK